MESQADPREAYEPPIIRRIEIVSDELAAVGCKQLRGMGPVRFCAVNPVGLCKVPGS